MIGRKIRHYEVIEKLGEGGMGVVYKANDTHLDRFVALKILPPEKLSHPGRKGRFIREAKAASSLKHPNIITIHDIAQEDGLEFIVMEYVAGKTLCEIIPPKGLTVTKALKYAVQITDALIRAHGAGIIHRDLKPGNIMVDEDDRIRVLDFGVAKLLEPSGLDSETAATNSVLTEVGAIVGSTAYMSPEQAEGRKVDARSDIFSFGLILYEMLSGHHAFQKNSGLSTLVAILHEEPPPLNQLIDYPPRDVEKIVLRCLRKDPAERYQNAANLRLELDEVLAAVAKDKPQTDHVPSVAVLPFENLSSEKENDYFSDGLAEEIINALAKVPGFRVVGRTSSFSFRGKQIGIHEIGEKLNVETLLEGSVRKSGRRLRITAQLVKAADGYQIWSERYDQTMEDIFDIQDEISQAIVTALRAKFVGDTGQEAQRAPAKRPAVGTEDIEAHEAYLKGRYYWNQRTWDSLRKGIRCFEQAIEKDPLHKQAYVGLADCYNLFGYYNERLPADTYPKAKVAAQRALEIDSNFAEAHASLGYSTLFFDWNWEKSEKEFKQAIELNPAYPSAHQWYGWYFFATHRLDEAIEAMRHAHALDPLAPIINNHLGLALATAGQYNRAIEQLTQSIEMSPSFALHYLVLGTVLLKVGKSTEAIENLTKAVELSPRQQLLGWIGHAYSVSGKREEAQRVINQLAELAKGRCVSPLSFALTYAGMGDADQTFDYLETAYEQRTSDLVRLKLYPWPEAIRSDARLTELARRIGLKS